MLFVFGATFKATADSMRKQPRGDRFSFGFRISSLSCFLEIKYVETDKLPYYVFVVAFVKAHFPQWLDFHEKIADVS